MRRIIAAVWWTVAAALIAYVGGSIVFGMVAVGTWLFPLAVGTLSSTALEWTVDIGTWACRVIVFCVVLYEWEKKRRRRPPQEKH